MKKQKVVILNITHGDNPYMDQPPFLPIAAGACRSDITNDACGEDNISAKNKWYGDFTSLYWAWKNLKGVDIIGTSHYRRYLCDVDELSEWQNRYLLNWERFKTREYDTSILIKLLKDCDFVMLKELKFEGTVKEQYLMNHPYPENIDITTEAIRKIHPEAVGVWMKILDENSLQPGYLFFTHWKLFDELCTWLYPVLQEIESHIDLTQYDGYQGRVIAYLYERLVPVFIMSKKYRVKQCALYQIDPVSNASVEDYKDRYNRETSLDVILLGNKRDEATKSDNKIMGLPHTISCRTIIADGENIDMVLKKAVLQTNAEYVAILKKNDFREIKWYIKHINYLQSHLECSMSTEAIRDWNITDPLVTIKRQIVDGNQVESLYTSVFRGKYLREIYEERVTLPTSEWIIGILMARYGYIGLIPSQDPTPKNIDWKGLSLLRKHYRLLKEANNCDRNLKCRYHAFFEEFKRNRRNDIRKNWMHYMPSCIQYVWHCIKN